MKPTLLEKVLAAVVVMLLATVAITRWQLTRSENATRTAGLFSDSLAAALDTSHDVALSRRDSVRILGDSIDAVGRRAFQVSQQNDALDQAQGLDRRAIATLTAQVRTLRTSTKSTAPVRIDTVTGARSATFTIDSTPHHDTLQVTLPAAGAGALHASLHLEPAAIGLRLGCGAKSTAGIRSAEATATGPTWLELQLGRVEQSPEVCNPVRESPGFLKRLLSSCGIGGGYAVLLKGGNGPALTADCRFWP